MPKVGAWTLSDTELLRRSYSNSSAGDIARVLGRDVKAVYAKAHALGLCTPRGSVVVEAHGKTVDGRSTATAQRLRAILVAGAQQENGIAVAEISGWTLSTISNTVMRMRKQGQLFSAKLSHKNSRYFATAEAAQGYQAARRLPGSSTRAVPNARLLHAPWPADAPAIITERTKITIAPAPPRVLRTNTHSS